MLKQSEKAFVKAQNIIAGGVNSPIRAFKGMKTSPVFIKKGVGAILTDIDDNNYIDYCISWGALILGHAHKSIVEAVNKTIQDGTSFGAPTGRETILAEMINECVPSMERIRFVNSGTEAVMSAIRLARAFTERKIIIKFDGCYHGHADHLLVSAGSGVSTLQNSSSSGVPNEFVQLTLSIPYNNQQIVEDVFKKYKNQIAAIIIEPVPANMGVIVPDKQFLKFLREITISNKSLLIFDEVITGFRIGLGGAQEYYDIKPDLTTLGKIIGGGFPVGAYGGRKEIMDLLAPIGQVYQAGTLSGNPVAMSAGIATLNELKKPLFYNSLEEKTSYLISNLREITKNKNIQINCVGSMFTLFFSEIPLTDFESVKQCNSTLFSSFHKSMLEKNIYLPPSQFEANFVSSAHSDKQIEETIISLKSVLK